MARCTGSRNSTMKRVAVGRSSPRARGPGDGTAGRGWPRGPGGDRTCNGKCDAVPAARRWRRSGRSSAPPWCRRGDTSRWVASQSNRDVVPPRWVPRMTTSGSVRSAGRGPAPLAPDCAARAPSPRSGLSAARAGSVTRRSSLGLAPRRRRRRRQRRGHRRPKHRHGLQARRTISWRRMRATVSRSAVAVRTDTRQVKVSAAAATTPHRRGASRQNGA